MRTVPRALSEFRELVERRAAALRTRSFSDLQLLDSDRPEVLSVQSRPAEIYTIVEPKPDGRIRVVLQGSMKPRLIPIGRHMAVAGFYKSPDGTVSDLSDRDVYEFA